MVSASVVTEALCRLVAAPRSSLGAALGAIGIVAAAWPHLSPTQRERVEAACFRPPRPAP